MKHIYSLIRFVPDPARGEFINVGAIAGSEESSEWGIRQISNAKRARAIGQSDTPTALQAVWYFIDCIGEIIDNHQDSIEALFPSDIEPSEDWLKALHSDYRNVVQLSPPTPLVAPNVDEALDRIFQHAILDPERQQRRSRWRNEVLAATRRAYRRHSVSSSELCERVVLSSELHEDRFDFAVMNGKALQLVRSWSFRDIEAQRLSSQIKSWGWTVRSTRDSGGNIEIRDSQSFAVNSDVDIEVVSIPPDPDQDESIYEEGKAVFEALGVRSVPLEQVDKVAERARQLLIESGSKLAM